MTKRWDYSDVADQRSKIKNPKSKINMDDPKGTPRQGHAGMTKAWYINKYEYPKKYSDPL